MADQGGYCTEHQRPKQGSFSDPNRGTRQERGYGGDWEAKRKRILERDKGLCQECLRNGRLTPVGHKPFSYFCDHITPKAEGGGDEDENLQALCKPCHNAKTDSEKNRNR